MGKSKELHQLILKNLDKLAVKEIKFLFDEDILTADDIKDWYNNERWDKDGI